MKTNSNNVIKTVADYIIAAKIRKGPAAGTNSKGAYWVRSTQDIAVGGGDGIGQSAPVRHIYLDLRHYRDGKVAAVVRWESYHQNTGHDVTYYLAAGVLTSKSAEEVVVALHQLRDDQYGELLLQSFVKKHVVAGMLALGLPEAAAAPDEEPVVANS